MSYKNTAVATFESHIEAEKAIGELVKANFDSKKLSIVGKDFHTQEHVRGFYNTGDRMKTWGKFGAFWGGIWGLLVGAAYFVIPGIGPIAIAGPVVGMLIGALEGSVVVGGLTALGAGLISLGIPKDSVIRYETELKAGKFVLIAHGTKDDVEEAKEILSGCAAEHLDTHTMDEEEKGFGAPGIF